MGVTRADAAAGGARSRSGAPRRLGRRWLTRTVLAALIALAALAASDAVRLSRSQQWNDAILGQRPVPDTVDMPPEMRFAEAHALAAGGKETEALDKYRALQGDGRVGQAARFNSANILLRQAIGIRGTNQPGQAIPLIELAKETYREILRTQPSHWDARYNLERAQRLLPDPDDDEGPPSETPRGAERAATTMRGYSAGLP